MARIDLRRDQLMRSDPSRDSVLDVGDALESGTIPRD